MGKLVPCPFCGQDRLSIGPVGVTSHAVKCRNEKCLVEGPLAASPDDAIVKWNDRCAIAAEREACAVAADNERSHDADELNEKHEQDPRSVDRYWLGWNDAAQTIAATIRARGEEGK